MQEASVSESRTTIASLYPEILAIIFSYLDVRDRGRAAQVCSYWRDANYQRSVWRRVLAKLHPSRSSPALYRSLVKRGIRRIQILSMTDNLRDVLQSVPNLESLSLSGCFGVMDSTLTEAFNREFTSLTKLDISMCKYVSDVSLDHIAENLKNLEVLELGGCCNITTVGVFMVARGLHKLKCLNLRSCCYVSDEGIRHVAGRRQDKASGNLLLEHLGLQDCQELSDQALEHVSHGLSHLRTVNLSFCANISDHALEYLAKMPSLKELNLKACDSITDSGIAYLAVGSSRLSNLDVSFCSKIGNAALVHMSQGLFNLRSLSLCGCKVTDDGVCKLAESLLELESLSIGQCDRITDRSLSSIAASLTSLSYIDLYGCSKVTPAGIDIIRAMPSMSTLNLQLCSLFTTGRLSHRDRH